VRRVALAALFAFKTNRYRVSYFNMIVLTTSASAQTFSFIPRDTPTSMVLTDDQTNTPVTVVITSQTTGDYVNTITADFDFRRRTFLRFGTLQKHGHRLQG
jgi:hypothetical protein